LTLWKRDTTDRRNEKKFQINKKKFAGSKKFPTFAVPNETGSWTTDVGRRIKKDWNDDQPKGTGGLTRPQGNGKQGVATYNRPPRGEAEKFIKEISF
jgi:hypothetical protein